MKKIVIFSALILLGFTLLSAQPQKGMKQGHKNVHPHKALHAINLSDDQKTSIKELRLEFSKNTLDVRNELRELGAKYKTLTSGENQSLDQIDENIEKRQELKTVLMKEKARMQIDFRKLLTEEQKILLDSRKGKSHGHRPKAPAKMKNANS